MTGLNDPGDDIAMGGNVGADKPLSQTEYDEMSQSATARDLVQRAEVALPSLVEICKALAGSLGNEEVGVGPVKEVGSSMRKAEEKYEGDVLKVTDYCRSLLVVKDFPTLLALLELARARDSFGPLIRRVKLSTLKTDRTSKPGGYRDCIINLELKDHICEISMNLWPMWVVCGVTDSDIIVRSIPLFCCCCMSIVSSSLLCLRYYNVSHDNISHTNLVGLEMKTTVWST
jgi:hypothetical protein